MARCRTTLGVLSVVALAGATAAADDRAVPLTSAEWRPSPAPFELHWELLDLPGRVVELALTPLRPIFEIVEQKRLDRRIYDLVSNEAKTAFLLPYVTVGGSDGVAGGLLFMHNDLFGEDERLRLSGALRGNLDYKVKATYEQAVARLDGRTVGARISYDHDTDWTYHGLGGDAPEDVERAVRSDELLVTLRGQLLGPELLYVSSDLVLTYRRQSLGPGDSPDVPALRRSDPEVAPLPGFEQTLDLPELGLTLTFDSRDSLGRTTRGFLARLEVAGTRDLNGASLSAFRAALDTSLFLEVLPRARVIVLSAGIGAATPWQSEHELPLRGYISLGRETHLRGYRRDRFLDRFGWWASAEYRYPVFEHERDELGLSSVLFFDLGRAGADAHGLFGLAPRWSAGFGVQADTAISPLLRLLVGFSPEGSEVTFSVGSLL